MRPETETGPVFHNTTRLRQSFLWAGETDTPVNALIVRRTLRWYHPILVDRDNEALHESPI